MDGNAIFFDAERHHEALELLASACLTSGDAAGAFRYADRLCRRRRPRARDLLLRSEASRRSGHPEFAALDLSLAVEADPTDHLVAMLVLQWGAEAQKIDIARAVLRDPLSERSNLRRALAVLFEQGERLLFRLERRDDRLTGWAAWRAGALSLRLDGESARIVELPANLRHALASSDWRCAEVEIADADGGPGQVDFLLDGLEAGRFASAPQATARRVVEPSGPRDDALLNVVIPVYEDIEATKACFAALFSEGGAIEPRIVVIDDASPNPNLRAWLDVQASVRKFTLIRNESNLGFAASVNKALALCPTGDALLLNADALPSPSCLERLARIARSAPDIGTITPLSNNGEFASFPEPHVANPLGSPEEVARLAALAWRANGLATVDLPNGIGFCLYITRACLDAVGPLPEIYARGYYEDVEFCLRAREKGFRNLCAPGVYVGHAGSRSFRADKRRLVKRNLATLEQRFPDCTPESLDFLRADPLAGCRGAIEALDPPGGEAILMVCGGGSSAQLAREEAALAGRRDEERNGAIVRLICRHDLAGGRVLLRNASGGAPQSLEFSLNDKRGLADLRDWLAAIDLRAVEIFDPLSLPMRLLKLLFDLGKPVDLAGGDCEWVLPARLPPGTPCRDAEASGPCQACASPFARDEAEAAHALRMKRRRPLLSKARSIRPLDRMSEVFARHVLGESLVAPDSVAVAQERFAPRMLAQGALAILSPGPCALADRLIVALGRALLRRGAARGIVVLGECVDDLATMAPGNVFVAGRVETGEYERLLAQYEVSALMSPYRTRFFGLLDRLSVASGLPKACFDWTYGKLDFAPGDLALDPRLCDAKAAGLLADWLGAPRRDSVCR